ncbi:hypothetical protein [Variovorax sp. PAMC 28711]|uniref:hypothetical protein n=1 Tax=Variovorax sp. PAMC 28711 TaxID=1795631 RepID=UPI00078CE922|nr:hypothetical protein [Variovorax sp. PAMC 28711]AMM25149.1 hypothetical protein AX767_12860 [Variovorax sp. PAMC 28711]
MKHFLRHGLFVFFIVVGSALVSQAAQAQSAGSADALNAQFKAMTARLDRNPFQRKLVLESKEGSNQLSGDIYAVVDHPFGEVGNAFKLPGTWCSVLMLHLNTKYCAVTGAATAPMLAVSIGRKFDQPVADASRVDFRYQVKSASAGYLDVELDAPSGPMSTRDYRILLEATPIGGGQTFIHLGYSYGYGTAARLAMQAYLGTLGSDKVGFTTTGKDSAGAPDYIGGVRGVVERNTMRYYLAIDAWLDAPAPQQLDKRLMAWFDATEQYARQLHEMSRDDYLSMKQSEFRRLATSP